MLSYILPKQKIQTQSYLDILSLIAVQYLKNLACQGMKSEVIALMLLRFTSIIFLTYTV